jgi:hypothetical protein
VVNKKLARRIKTKTTELASKELYPITSSRFIIYHAIIANLCALLALLPDIGILWGDSGLDHGLWANIFFFHTTIDNLPGNLVSTYTIYVFINVLILWVLIVSIAINAQIDKDCKENTYI